jgi:hypothetical protein
MRVNTKYAYNTNTPYDTSLLLHVILLLPARSPDAHPVMVHACQANYIEITEHTCACRLSYIKHAQGIPTLKVQVQKRFLKFNMHEAFPN